MRINLDLELDSFIEENDDQRVKLLALLRDSIESTIRTHFKADSLNGLELNIDDDMPNDGAAITCWNCDELTSIYQSKCESCGVIL